MDEYVHYVYFITKKFPKDELFGVTSQLKRASLSVVLNYIEGYARLGEKSNKSFAKISYASLKESRYLLHFSLIENFITSEEFSKADNLADKIGGMLYGMLKDEK